MSAATKRRRTPPSDDERAERRAAERRKMEEAIEALQSRRAGFAPGPTFGPTASTTSC